MNQPAHSIIKRVAFIGNYPPRVRFELTEKDIESHRRAADFLNINNVDNVVFPCGFTLVPDGDTLHYIPARRIPVLPWLPSVFVPCFNG